MWLSMDLLREGLVRGLGLLGAIDVKVRPISALLRKISIVGTCVCLLIRWKLVFAAGPHVPLNQYRLDSWSEAAGLPQNYIKTIQQTTDGYLWVGTKGGLARFDGVRFVVYSDHHPNQLQEVEVWAVAEDDQGLWIGTFGGGLTRLKNGIFTTIRAKSSELASDVVTALAVVPGGGVWVGTDKGVCYYSGTFTCWGKSDGLPSEAITLLHLDAQGVLWIGTKNGLASYYEGKISNYAERYPGSLDARIQAIVSHPEHGLWLGTASSGLVNLRADTYLTTYNEDGGLPSNAVHALVWDELDALWIGTNLGLVRLVNGQLERFQEEQLGDENVRVMRSVAFRRIEVLAKDREGGIWVGTCFDGIARLRTEVFKDVHRGWLTDFAQSVVVDGAGVVWVGTSGGLAKFDHGKTSLYSNPSLGKVRTLFQDRNEQIWVGTTNGLGRLYDNKVEALSVEGLDGESIQAVVETSDGVLWFGTRSNGVTRYEDGEATHFGSMEGLEGGKVRSMVLGAQDRLWVGTKDDGLFYLDGNRFVPEPSFSGGDRKSVYALWVDDERALWFSTRHGLKRLKNGKLSTLTFDNGLASNFIYNVIDDKQGDLWLTYGNGIMRASERSLRAVADGFASRVDSHIYGWRHGLDTMTMSLGHFNASFRSRDDRLFFLNGYGVAYVDPTQIQYNHLPPPVWVEEVRLGNEFFPVHEEAEFLASRETLEIRYTGLSFESPEYVRFQRKLQGFNNTWKDVAGERVAYYTNLPPGNYRFRVRACNNDGVWNDTGASYSFRVLPHWYERPTTKAFGILFAFCSLFLGYSWRLRGIRANELRLAQRVASRTQELAQVVERQRLTAEQLHLEMQERERAQEDLNKLNAELGERVAIRTAQLAEAAEKAEEASRSKSRFLANMSHEIRTPMNGILGMTTLALEAESLSEQRESLRLVKSSGEALLRVINDILDFSKIEAGHLELVPDFFQIRTLIKDAIQLMSLHAEQKGLRLFGQVAPEVPKTLVGDSGRLNQVILNLLGNAMKFTEQGEIELGVRVESRSESKITLHTFVRDTGTGIPEDKQQAIFAAFTQVDGSSTRRVGGTGLGLAISARLVEMMGGQLKVESELGKGSMFHWTALFECDQKDTGATTQSLQGQTSSLPYENSVVSEAECLSILLAEDNIVNQMVAVRVLEKRGHRVTVVSNGREAVEATAKQRPDVVLMDIQMPEMNGFEATAAIRAREKGTGMHLPIIAMTAHALKEDRARCLANGMDDYVTKPFKRADLFSAVENASSNIEELRSMSSND